MLPVPNPEICTCATFPAPNPQPTLDPHALIENFGTFGVAAALFAETGLLVGFFLPGDSLLVTAGLLWTVGITLAGYTLGRHVHNIDHYLLPIIVVVVSVSLMPTGLELLRARRTTVDTADRRGQP